MLTNFKLSRRNSQGKKENIYLNRISNFKRYYKMYKNF